MRKCWHWRNLYLHKKKVCSFLISAVFASEIVPRLVSCPLLIYFSKVSDCFMLTRCLFLSLSRSPHTKWAWVSAWCGGRPCWEGRRQWWWVGTGRTQKQNLHHPAGRFHPHTHHRHIRWPHQVGFECMFPCQLLLDTVEQWFSGWSSVYPQCKSFHVLFYIT